MPQGSQAPTSGGELSASNSASEEQQTAGPNPEPRAQYTHRPPASYLTPGPESQTLKTPTAGSVYLRTLSFET